MTLQELLARVVEVARLASKHASPHNLLGINIRPYIQSDLIPVQCRQPRMQCVHPTLALPIQVDPEERTTLHILCSQKLLATIQHIAPALVERSAFGDVDEGELGTAVVAGGLEYSEEGGYTVALTRRWVPVEVVLVLLTGIV
jgi:hypothetical protein